MNNLTVFQKDGKLWTDSREVADFVGKGHAKLLRDIRTYIDYMNSATNVDESKNGLISVKDFFVEGTFQDAYGREQPCFHVSKKGCEMVGNKLTGEKGVLFTAAYVSRFNEMEQKLQPKLSAMDMLKLQNQAMLELDERTAVVESKLMQVEDKVDNQMTIDSGKQRSLQAVVAKKVYERLGCTFPPDQISEQAKKFFAALYRDIKNRFGVPSYRDIKPAEYASAIRYVEGWIEPAELREGTKVS